MSYINPEINEGLESEDIGSFTATALSSSEIQLTWTEIPGDDYLTGLDKAIRTLQITLREGLPWLQKSFGRARLMPDTNVAGSSVVPKVYQSTGEYYSVLPNDFLDAYSFVQLLEAERFTEYDFTNPGNNLTAKIGIIFYFNLEKIAPIPGGVFTSGVKNEILKVLKNDTDLILERIYDEKIRDIFEGYTTTTIPGHLLYYPWAAIKYTGTLSYAEEC